MDHDATQPLPVHWRKTYEAFATPEPRLRYPRDTASLVVTTPIPVPVRP